MADVEIRGLKELGDKLGLLAANIQKTALRKSLAAGAEEFRREIRLKAPVRQDERPMGKDKRMPGYLKKHIGRWIRVNKDGSGEADVGPTKKAFYGRFYEMGTKHQPPRPFMRPAFDTKKESAFNAFAAEMRKWLGDLVK